VTRKARLFEAVANSKSPWLPAMTRIALETCMRQAELAGLTWPRVRLEGEYSYADLPKTKNDRPRRVPLGRAVGISSNLNEVAEVLCMSCLDF
jgi:integrase